MRLKMFLKRIKSKLQTLKRKTFLLKLRRNSPGTKTIIQYLNAALRIYAAHTLTTLILSHNECLTEKRRETNFNLLCRRVWFVGNVRQRCQA